MVDPTLLCRAHLLGEHREMHALAGMVNKNISLDGYIDNKMIVTGEIQRRHDHLAQEMVNRGYRHASPLAFLPPTLIGHVDPQANLQELHRRCPACRERITNATPSR